MKSLIDEILEGKLGSAKETIFSMLDEKAKDLVVGYKESAIKSIFESEEEV